MNLTNLQTIKNLCKNNNIWPQKKQGQNFLIDKKVLDKLLETANLKSSDIILEVGAGFGVITKELVKHVKKVIAVELDNNLIPILRENTRGSKNLTIINDDILKLDLKECGIQNAEYKIVANLPYSITSRFIRNILSQSPKPKDMTLIIQREVADRICAKPGGDMSLLSVSVQFYAKSKIISYIKPESFWPEPKVESAIIKIGNIGACPAPEKSRFGACPAPNDREEFWRRDEKFFRIAKIGFSARRKMLKNNLVAGLKVEDSKIQEIMESIGLSKTARAQDLGVGDWVRLVNTLP